jgi:hypothetical protein
MRVRYAAGGPSRPGLEGTELGVGHTGETFALGNGGSAWFGPAGDPFWGDAPALFAFTQGLAENQYRPELFTATPGNLLAGRNVPPSPFRSRTSRSAAPTSPCGPRSACTGTVPGGRSAGRPIRCCGRCSSRSPARTPRRSTPVRRPATSPRSARPCGRLRRTWQNVQASEFASSRWSRPGRSRLAGRHLGPADPLLAGAGGWCWRRAQAACSVNLACGVIRAGGST